MMKKLFGIFIPLCIFSFIAFGMSAAILGTGYGSSGLDYGDAAAEYVTSPVVGTATSSSWDITERYSNIRLDVGAFNVMLAPGDDDTTYFHVTRIDGDNTDIYTEIVGDTLEITIDDSFKNINFGFDYLDRLIEAVRTGSGFDEIFSNSRLDIIVPQQIYESLDVNIGSGSLEIYDLNAYSNTLCLGSGSLFYSNATGFTSDQMDISINSGYVEAYGARTREYDIYINSGRYEIFDLSGEGEIEINSGTGNIGFFSVDGDCEIDMNSGSMDIYIPYGTSMKVNAFINSGGVSVSTDEHNSKLRDGDSLTIGGGRYKMDIDVNSGNIRLTEETADVSIVEEVPPIDFAVITDSNTAFSEAVEELVGVVAEQTEQEIHFIEAPQAPEAPSAPSFTFSLSDYAWG